MPRDISNIRVARSFLTPAVAEAISAEMDFQLGIRQGIKIHAVLGTLPLISPNPGVAHSNQTVFHTLHMETGTLEDPLDGAGQDAINIDTEIFYRQEGISHSLVTAAAGAGYALSVHPTEMVVYPVPILVARNITHRAESVGIAGSSYGAIVYIYYNYVEYTAAEMGILLARRA